MGHGIIQHALHGQISVITPFTLAGAMAPVTLAGALAQQNAEFLAGLTLAQCAKPGAPVIYGGFTSNVDMKSGAPAFGTPEYVKAVQAGGQRDPALRRALPLFGGVRGQYAGRAGGAGDADVAVGDHDRRGRYGHARGGLDGGRAVGLVREDGHGRGYDPDAAGLHAAHIEVSEATLGLDAIAEVGPGRALLRHPTDHGAVRDRLLRADALGLAQLRDLGRGRQQDRLPACQRRSTSSCSPSIRSRRSTKPRGDALNDFVDRRIAEGGSFDDD